jgi:hypothetical protein
MQTVKIRLLGLMTSAVATSEATVIEKSVRVE